MCIAEIMHQIVNRIYLAQIRFQWRTLVVKVVNLQFFKKGSTQGLN
jgi:hypothetical protein